jgi:cation:H+ antiporter
MARETPSSGLRPPTRSGGLADLPSWQVRLAMMAAATVPGLLLRISGAHVPPLLGCIAFGGAVMAAGFLLGTAAEAAEIDLPSGLAVAAVAFVAVLPEYVIEIHFAFSGQVELTTASLTGATRLLLSFAVGMPALAALVLRLRGRRVRQQPVRIDPRRRVDLAIIAAASVYAPFIVLRGHLSWQDAVVLLGLYFLYLRRVSTGEPEAPTLVGVAAELANLPKRQRKRWVAGLMGFSALAILLTAEPFAHAVMGTGTMVGISPYLLVQWLVPVATEMPELVIAFILVVHHRPGQSVAVLLSSAVSQWTLAVGTLPLAFAAGAGQGPLPLLARERVELLLTMGLGLFAVATLVTLRLRRSDATLMLALFGLQVVIGSVWLRAAMTVLYLVLAVDVLSSERWALSALARALRGDVQPTPQPRPGQGSRRRAPGRSRSRRRSPPRPRGGEASA